MERSPSSIRSSPGRGPAALRRAAASTSLAPAILGIALAGAPVRAATLPPTFDLQPVIVNVFEPGRPVAFAELPDGRFLILERNTGQIRLHPVGGVTAPVIHTVPDVGTASERGLLGVAIDPNWPARPYVYLHYTHVSLTVRIVMLTASGELEDPLSTNLSLGSEFQLLSDIPDVSPIHNGGTVRFGTDGLLYVSLGDDGNACNAQNLGILAGKILRLDVSAMPGAGSGPPPKSAITPLDNPFAGPGDNERLVWVWGLRNPFRFSIDAETNDLFLGDVGLISFEEVDHVPFAGGGGENWGWPHWEGFFDPGLGLSCGAANSFSDPIYTYAHGDGASVVAGPRYRMGGGKHEFPDEYEGAVLVSDVWQGWFRWLVDAGSGWDLAPDAPGQPNSQDWATGLYYIVDSQRGSDGAIYLLQLVPYTGSPSGLYRIVPNDPSSAASMAASAPSFLAAPNPASPASGTRITWSSGRGAARTARIVNAAGRLVRTIDVPSGTNGAAGIEWDVRDEGGAPVPTGMYLVSIRGDGAPAIEGKVLVVR